MNEVLAQKVTSLQRCVARAREARAREARAEAGALAIPRPPDRA